MNMTPTTYNIILSILIITIIILVCTSIYVVIKKGYKEYEAIDEYMKINLPADT